VRLNHIRHRIPDTTWAMYVLANALHTRTRTRLSRWEFFEINLREKFLQQPTIRSCRSLRSKCTSSSGVLESNLRRRPHKLAEIGFRSWSTVAANFKVYGEWVRVRFGFVKRYWSIGWLFDCVREKRTTRIKISCVITEQLWFFQKSFVNRSEA